MYVYSSRTKVKPRFVGKRVVRQGGHCSRKCHDTAVFMEHSDYTNLVEISDDNKFLDVNFPSDVEQIAKPRED